MKSFYFSAGFACNRACLSCPVSLPTKKSMAAPADWKAFLARSRPEPGDLFTISGGEPTLWAGLPKMVRALNRRGVAPVILTNAKRFADTAFARRFRGLRFEVQVCLYSHRPALFDYVAGEQGGFERTMAGLDALVGLAADVKLKTIVLRQNYRELPELFNFITRRFPLVRYLGLHGTDYAGRAARHAMQVGVSLSAARPYIQKAIDAIQRHDVTLEIYYIPFCVLHPSHWPYRRQIPFTHLKESSLELTQFRGKDGKVPKCRKCVLYSQCDGTWPSYYRYFGTGAIRPIGEQELEKLAR